MNALSRGLPLAPLRLRRDGQPPLCFRGAEIGRHDGHAPQAGLWHDLALYRADAGGYVVSIVARMPTGAARCHAARADTLEAALTLLETHDPGGDLCPGLSAPALDCCDPALSPASLIVRAAALRCALDDVGRRYRIGVGRFLMTLADRAL
jgi:hypothetical protein